MISTRVIVTVAMAMVASAGGADARSQHPEGRRGVPAMLAPVLPAVVSITTRDYISVTNDHLIEGVDQRCLKQQPRS
jgi:hypothetical protein